MMKSAIILTKKITYRLFKNLFTENEKIIKFYLDKYLNFSLVPQTARLRKIGSRADCGTFYAGGRGGGAELNKLANSWTSPAGVHCAIPSFHTKVSRVSCPD